MKKYIVKTEYVDSWTNEDVELPLIVDEDEIRSLASGWGVTVEELMEQVEEAE